MTTACWPRLRWSRSRTQLQLGLQRSLGQQQPLPRPHSARGLGCLAGQLQIAGRILPPPLLLVVAVLAQLQLLVLLLVLLLAVVLLVVLLVVLVLVVVVLVPVLVPLLAPPVLVLLCATGATTSNHYNRWRFLRRLQRSK
jgi:hypothetical protein